MPLLLPTWRCFQDVPSDAEASSFSERCLFSLATLEVDCDPETNRFALTEQERPDAWRWAIVNDRGVVLKSGCALTQAEAKTTAGAVLRDGSAGLIAKAS